MAESKPAEKTSPIKYLGQVRQEGRKVVWPTWRETVTTTILVMVMVVLMGAFFFVVDWFVATGLKLILSAGGVERPGGLN